ncbi:cytochrome P450 [Nocardia sp. NPDC050175]|uniref:cytochrome P450 n=1 Tax=Nocardia sp. NPDC050175 TaxID=3364317 RepID=UPI003798FCD2
MDTIPVAPGRLPILGHALRLSRDPLGFLESTRSYGDVVRIYLGRQPMYLVTDPGLTRDVLVGRVVGVNRDGLADGGRELFGSSVATLSGRIHRDRRRLYAPALRNRRVLDYVPMLAEHAGHWARSLREDVPVALDRELFALSLSGVSATLFGVEPEPAVVHTVQRDLPVAVHAAVARQTMPGWSRGLPLPIGRRFQETTVRLRTVCAAMIAARRSNPKERRDLLSDLMFEPIGENGATLSQEEVVDELCGLLVAGVDTPAATLGWIFHELAEQPEVARRLHAEVDSVLGSGVVTAADLRSLDYTRWVVQEAIRKYAAWINPMRTDAPTDIAGVRVPGNATLAVSLYMLHHDRRVFENPDLFDPMRWAPERAKLRPHDAAIPFGLGPRKCPGDIFAMTELMVYVATIAAQWEFHPRHGATVHPVTRGVVVHPDHLPMIPRARAPAIQPVCQQGAKPDTARHCPSSPIHQANWPRRP